MTWKDDGDVKTLATNMLRHRATLIVPTGATAWRAPDGGTTYSLERIHVQRTRHIVQDQFDTAREPAAELWFDARLSRPHGLNWTRLQIAAENAGDWLRVKLDDGVTYRVQLVDELPDGMGGIHHWRMELI